MRTRKLRPEVAAQRAKKALLLELKSQSDELQKGVFFQAERFGYDLLDDSLTERLLEIAQSPMESVPEERDTAERYIERFIALAYLDSLLAFNSEEDQAERIGALCQGNWLVGVLGGMDDPRPPRACSTCIIKNYATELARANAGKRYLPFREAEAFVKSAWEAERESYGNNKSEFVRTYVKLVANQFKDRNGNPLKVTEKQIREVWLKSTPSASKPAS